MDAALPHVPLNLVIKVLQSMSLIDRLKCALVCKAWAGAATAATRSIIRKDGVHDLSCIQAWLEKHGGQLEVLQLGQYRWAEDVLAALPCPQLEDLMLGPNLILDSRVWTDITAATKVTSVCLERVDTPSQEADVVSALTALPDLEQLTWSRVICREQGGLSDSKLLQKLTKLTALKLDIVPEVQPLQHLGLLTRLQDLSLAAGEWAEVGCPGLQELKALTRLDVVGGHFVIPTSISQLTALQQLHVGTTTPTALYKLSALTGLTRLYVRQLEDPLPESPPLALPGLQDLMMTSGDMDGLNVTMPMSFLAGCTQLQVLHLCHFNLSPPGSLVASSMLQHLELDSCMPCRALMFCTADEAVDPLSWQQVFPGQGQLPHLTSLRMIYFMGYNTPHAGIECVASCCSSLQVLHLDTLPDSLASALPCLSGLTSLIVRSVSDQQCSSLAQLTGLRELSVHNASQVFAAGLRQLVALEQLTSLVTTLVGQMKC